MYNVQRFPFPSSLSIDQTTAARHSEKHGPARRIRSRALSLRHHSEPSHAFLSDGACLDLVSFPM